MNRGNGNGFFIIFLIILIVGWIRRRRQASLFNKPQLPTNSLNTTTPQLPISSKETKTETK